MAKYHINAKGEPGKCRAWLGNCPFGGDSEHHETAEGARVAFEKSMAEANTPEPLRKVEQEKPAFEYDEKYVERDANGNVELYGFEHRGGDFILTKNGDNSYRVDTDYVGNSMDAMTFSYDGDPKDMESIGAAAVTALNDNWGKPSNIN